MQKQVLIIGGLGYIGAHLVKELADRGHSIHVVDRDGFSPNLEFVSKRAMVTVDEVGPDTPLHSYHGDAIINLAAYISVEESVRYPIKYWLNNMGILHNIIQRHTDHLIFASTGTAFDPASPYAWTKVAGEQLIRDCAPDNAIGYTIFRFYNVSGLGANIKPTGQPTHLIRIAAMAARGLIPGISVYGDDYNTVDGTCVRDYIHVQDIAASIANAVDAGPSNTPYECLGSGAGSSVMEVINTMKRVTGTGFKVNIVGRRPGDVASMVCPTQYNHISLSKSLEDMCLSAYHNI